mgnify:CR=1 FL=1
MTYTTITYGGIDYQCRVLKDSLDDDVIIASLDLLAALQPETDENGEEEFASKEAENLYDEILYFTDAVKLQLDDAQLIELLKAESTDLQDWFD